MILPLPAMVIAACIKNIAVQATGSRCYIHELLKNYAVMHPGHRIVIFYETGAAKTNAGISNIEYIKAAPAIPNRLLQKIWLDVKLPRLLKKNQADVFINTALVFSSRVSIPQIIAADPGEKFRKSAHRQLEKAAAVFAFSKNQKTNIADTVPGVSGKIKILTISAGSEFQPRDQDQKAAVKKKFTDGREYFLFAGAVTLEKEFISLLKAFSHFKKRQQSSMKLVVLIDSDSQEKITAGLGNYKYRQDVLVTGATETAAAPLYAAAYGIVYFSQPQLLPLPVTAAVQSAIPVICSDDEVNKELAGDAALYVNRGNYKDLGEKMMMLYTNETLRLQLIEKGKLLAPRLSRFEAVSLLAQYIHETTG